MSSLTPLGFTREYQAYRAATTAIPFPDSRLLAAVRFWSRFPEALASDLYSSFWLEDLPPLLAIDTRAFDDLHPDELAEIATFIAGLDPAHLNSPLTAASLWEHAARKWLYVGQVDSALTCLANAGFGLSRTESREMRPVPSEVEGIAESGLLAPNSERRNWQSVDATETPRLLIRLFGDMEGERTREPALVRWLETFDADWRAIRESGHTNQATCVLVERDAGGKPVRGRLRTLEAHIEALPKGRNADEVVFGHQLCTADDPQVRGAYAAVASLRHETQRSSNPQFPRLRSGQAAIPLTTLGTSRNLQLHFRARFTFANDNREPYGGDSLAFACFTAAYGDWWSKDLHRERRLVAAQVALTGALKSDGQAESVAENSLEQKIERVFFSPLSYLVVPQPNREAAESTVAALHSKYPNRRLRILTADRASDLISDGNITIPERVCLGEYAVRAAAKYSRSVKVQVPLLALLVYLLVCLLYPKAWPWFDDDPSKVMFSSTGVTVLNGKGQELWEFDFGDRHDSVLSLATLGNIDADPDNEVVCLLNPLASDLTQVGGQFFAFDSDGRLMFERSAIILGQYPGDTTTFQSYQSHSLEVLHTKSGTRILTEVSKWMPARVHLKIWDTDGGLVSWYINAGAVGSISVSKAILDSASNELHCTGVNNRTKAACLFTINLDSAFGASPPYVDPDLDLSQIKHGNQVRYLIFPPTDLCRVRAAEYNASIRFVEETPTIYRYSIDELGGNRSRIPDSVAEVMYYLDRNLQIIDVRCGDSFLSARNDMVAQGRLSQVDWKEYQAELSRRVKYWDDTGWVSRP